MSNLRDLSHFLSPLSHSGLKQKNEFYVYLMGVMSGIGISMGLFGIAIAVLLIKLLLL